MKRTEYVVGVTCPVGYIGLIMITFLGLWMLPQDLIALTGLCCWRVIITYFLLPGQSSVPRSDRRFTAWFTRFRGLKPPWNILCAVSVRANAWRRHSSNFLSYIQSLLYIVPPISLGYPASQSCQYIGFTFPFYSIYSIPALSDSGPCSVATFVLCKLYLRLTRSPAHQLARGLFSSTPTTFCPWIFLSIWLLQYSRVASPGISPWNVRVNNQRTKKLNSKIKHFFIQPRIWYMKAIPFTTIVAGARLST